MLKCPMPGCSVVIAPKRAFTNDDTREQQRTGLINHLKGIESSWYGCSGHSIVPEYAEKIADEVCMTTEMVEKALV